MTKVIREKAVIIIVTTLINLFSISQVFASGIENLMKYTSQDGSMSIVN